MTSYLYEFIGTGVLVLLGNGVVANVVLQKTKGHGSGLIVIAFGWAMAVFVGVMVSAKGSGAHLNSAVTLTMAYLGRLSWAEVPGYLLAQVAGAFFGSVLVWITYRKHYEASPNADDIMATFCTSPAIAHDGYNLIAESVGTFVLILGILFITNPVSSLGTLDGLPVALLVLAIGCSLGGATGYAINPARDFGPRLAHFLLPIKGKQHSNWRYALIPIVGPLLGGALATVVWLWLQNA